MPRKTRSSLETATARSRLPVQKKPHWQRLGPGLSLGYRRNQGAGTWSIRAADGAGKEWLKKFGLADDHEAADGKRVLSYDQAVTEARRLARRGQDEDRTRPVTLAEALAAYQSDLVARGADPDNAVRARRHLTPTLLSMPVALLNAGELKSWRNGLVAKGLAAATVNRIRNALRAALELVAKRRSHVWREGLEALPGAQRARNVVLSDAEVLALVAAAYRHDPALGLLCDVLATTGARPGQAVRLAVEDLHAEDGKPRLMMPCSGKGGGRGRAEKKTRRYAVPITAALAARLRTAAQGRPGDVPLLLQSGGRPWGRNPYNDYVRSVRLVVASLGHYPAVVTIYALRHSSITRQLLRGVPIRIVAAAHDTSVSMIEAHYGAHIHDHADELTRGALLQPEPPAGDNIVPLLLAR
jgi:integrase